MIIMLSVAYTDASFLAVHDYTPCVFEISYRNLKYKLQKNMASF